MGRQAAPSTPAPPTAWLLPPQPSHLPARLLGLGPEKDMGRRDFLPEAPAGGQQGGGWGRNTWAPGPLAPEIRSGHSTRRPVSSQLFPGGPAVSHLKCT